MSDWAAKLLEKPARATTAAAKPASPGAVPPPAPVPQQKPFKPYQKKGSPKTYANGRRSALPEPSNTSELLKFLAARYEADVAATRSSDGDSAVVYRSLDSLSAWTTKAVAGGKKAARSDDGYNLLVEINRSMQAKVKK